VLIAHNTFVNVTDQIVTRDAGLRQRQPRAPHAGQRHDGQQHDVQHERDAHPGNRRHNWTWAGNIAFGTTVGKSGSGIINSTRTW
jgi:hypothetical protein